MTNEDLEKEYYEIWKRKRLKHVRNKYTRDEIADIIDFAISEIQRGNLKWSHATQEKFGVTANQMRTFSKAIWKAYAEQMTGETNEIYKNLITNMLVKHAWELDKSKDIQNMLKVLDTLIRLKSLADNIIEVNVKDWKVQYDLTDEEDGEEDGNSDLV